MNERPTSGACKASSATEAAARVAEIKEARRALTAAERALPRGSRPLSIAHTNLEEAVMWLTEELRRLDDLNQIADEVK